MAQDGSSSIVRQYTLQTFIMSQTTEKFPDPWPWINNCLEKWYGRIFRLYRWCFRKNRLAPKEQVSTTRLNSISQGKPWWRPCIEVWHMQHLWLLKLHLKHSRQDVFKNVRAHKIHCYVIKTHQITKTIRGTDMSDLKVFWFGFFNRNNQQAKGVNSANRQGTQWHVTQTRIANCNSI